MVGASVVGTVVGVSVVGVTVVGIDDEVEVDVDDDVVEVDVVVDRVAAVTPTEAVVARVVTPTEPSPERSANVVGSSVVVSSAIVDDGNTSPRTSVDDGLSLTTARPSRTTSTAIGTTLFTTMFSPAARSHRHGLASVGAMQCATQTHNISVPASSSRQNQPLGSSVATEPGQNGNGDRIGLLG